MPTGLTDLPPELLGQVVHHVRSVKELSSLSKTCKLVRDYIRHDGYRIFVQSNFPSLRTPPYWEGAAHTLTTLTKCWDRKALLARYITPRADVTVLPHGRVKAETPSRRNGRIPGSQSMGYQPVIDCYQEWNGDAWSHQTETLAIGAGAELRVRLRSAGNDIRDSYLQTPDDVRKTQYNHLGQREQWITWEPPKYVDGRDDITALNIVRGDHGRHNTERDLVVGRASGILEKIRLSPQGVSSTQYNTRDRSVQSAHLSPADKPILAACFSDGAVALYDSEITATTEDAIDSISEMSVLESSKASRPWTTKFLDQRHLAVGRGPSKTPIMIHELNESGFAEGSVRSIGMGSSERSSRLFDEQPSTSSSVYSIMPLSPTSPAGAAEGGLFLSGWYTGEVKLHDLRSKSDAVASFIDPIDPSSPVYSLLPFGSERFVAGGAWHSQIKVFDLRMSGDRRYSSRGLEHTSDKPDSKPTDFNIFLAQPDERHSRASMNRAESPVYTLAAGSAFSPVFYAGLENSVLEVNLVSGTDRHPDSIFKPITPLSRPFKRKEVPNWLDPHHNALSLALIEHLPGGALNLKKQSPVRNPNVHDEGTSLDYRWSGVSGRYEIRGSNFT